MAPPSLPTPPRAAVPAAEQPVDCHDQSLHGICVACSHGSSAIKVSVITVVDGEYTHACKPCCASWRTSTGRPRRLLDTQAIPSA